VVLPSSTLVVTSFDSTYRISIAKFVLLDFFALQNTPLAPFSGQSYEKLRLLHKTAGYTCITTSVIHGIIYTVESLKTGVLHKFSELDDLAGLIDGLAKGHNFLFLFQLVCSSIV
jgi:hypothetical protein